MDGDDWLETIDQSEGLVKDFDLSSEEIVKNCRGIVFDGDSILFKGYPYTPEYTYEDYDYLNTIDISNFKAFNAREGTLLRLFYHNDDWMVSTHRRLDAYSCRWGSRKTFGTLLEEAFESEVNISDKFKELLDDIIDVGENSFKRWLTLLDKKSQYMLLLETSEDNRIVCRNGPEPRVYNAGVITDGKLSLEFNGLVGLQTPPIYEFPTSLDESSPNNKELRDASQMVCFDRRPA